jgi:hypothetical protein
MLKGLVDVLEVAPVVNDVLVSDANAVINLSARGKKAFELIAPKLKEGVIIECVTNGEFSLHELIECLILNVCGNSKVYIASWTIKEVAVRCFDKLKQLGFVTDLHGFFDYRAKNMDAKTFPFAEAVFNSITLSKMHAKCCVIEGEKLQLTIVSTANLSQNNRQEIVIVNASARSVEFYKNWLCKLQKKI